MTRVKFFKQHRTDAIARRTVTPGRRMHAMFAVSGLAAVVTLGGCGSSGTTAGPTDGGDASQASGASQAAAAPNGITASTFTIEANAPTSLNPAVGPIGQTATVEIYPLYGALIFQKQDGTFVPDIATKWGYVAGSNNKKFTLTVRPGVKFSDGATLAAQAVVDSIHYFIKANGPQASQLANLTTIKATGPDTVEMDFSQPTPNLPFLLSQTQGIGAIIGPKGLANPNSLATNSDGAGPYTIRSSDVVANQQYTYHASPTYYDQDAIHFKTVVVKTVVDQNSIVSSLQSGQLDAATPSGLPGIVQPAKSAGLNVDGEAFGISALILADRAGAVTPALGNVKVRQAINCAIDRKQLAQLIGGSDGQPTNQLAMPGAVGYSDANASDYAYDPAKAKALLAAAGYANGFSFDILDSGATDPNGIVGQAIVAELARVGIKANLVMEQDMSQFIPAALSKKYPVVLFTTPYFGDGYYNASRLAIGSFENPFGSTSPVLNKLYATAAASTSAAQQKAALAKVSAWYSSNAWFAPVAGSVQNVIYSSKVQGVQPTTPAAPGIWSPFGPTAALSWYVK